MREMQHTISKKLTLTLFCIIGCLISGHLVAQDDDDDDDDTSILYSDTAVVSPEGDNYQGKKHGKYSDVVIFRSVPDTTVARMKREKEFAYANDPAYWVKEKKEYRKGFWDYFFDFFESGLVRLIFYILLAALAIFVLYRIIVVNDLFIFYSSKKQKKSFEESETTELDPALINQKIQEAIDQKNFHNAVRYLYLKTLYTLNDKNWIQFHMEATNKQYLNQMGQHKQIKEFRFLTQVYEYVWYGKFQLSEQQFSLVYDSFKNFQTSI